MSARCAAEVGNASVALPPGTGDIDGITAACRAGTLGAFVLRGHVLSWTSRGTAQGAPLTRPVVVATGADRLGPVAPDAPEGPVAWRSPIAGLDTAERDDLWAGRVTAGDGGPRALRGDAVMPAGVAGLGVPFARVSGEALRVTATFAREGSPPVTASVAVTPGRDAPTEVAQIPAGFTGQIEAWEPSRDVSLARVDRDDGAYLEARYADGRVARHRLAAPEALVVPRGVATRAGAVFLVGEFALGRDGDDGGACVGAAGGACVRPGAVSILVAGDDGVLRAHRVASRGVPDALARDGDGIIALFVEPGVGDATTQRATRVDPATGALGPIALEPPAGFPPIDTPQLATCDDGVWIVAAVSLRGDAGARAGVTAIPLDCLLRE